MTFEETIKVQIEDGGKKYASSSRTMEITDILTSRYGFAGLMWTINKYYFRFKNIGMEKDLQKIGAYMFITWLKWGKHLGDLTKYNKFKMVDTNLELKKKYLPVFLASLEAYRKTERSKDILKIENKVAQLELLDQTIEYVYNNFERCNIEETCLFDVFIACSDLFKLHGFTGEDTDSAKLTSGKIFVGGSPFAKGLGNQGTDSKKEQVVTTKTSLQKEKIENEA